MDICPYHLVCDLVSNFSCICMCSFCHSSAFRLLASPELGCDLLSVFELDVRQKVRQQVIALVFSTNLTDHFFFLGIMGTLVHV